MARPGPSLTDDRDCGSMPKAAAYVPYTGPIVTRKAAKAAGKTRYFTGKPCKHGHLEERFTSVGRCVVCARIYASTWKRLNFEQWLKNHSPEKLREYYRARFAKLTEEDLEKHRVHTRNRRARKKGNGGSHSAAQIRDLLVKQRHRCPSCSASLRRGYHVDHIMPIALGGSNDISNIQLLCRVCNERKSFLHPVVWAQRNGRLL